MRSLERFISAHGSEVEASILGGLPPSLRAMDASISIENSVTKIGVIVSWRAATGSIESIPLEPIEISEAADIDEHEFGADCDMGW